MRKFHVFAQELHRVLYCIESDAKSCIDALSPTSEDCPWSIHAQTSYSLELSLHFHLCSFFWMRRGANQLAHELAKVARSLHLPFSCNLASIPPLLKRHGLGTCSFFLLNEILTQQKNIYKQAHPPRSPPHSPSFRRQVPTLYLSSKPSHHRDGVTAITIAPTSLASLPDTLITPSSSLFFMKF